MKKVFFFAVFLFISGFFFAQRPPQDQNNGAYVEENIPTKYNISYPFLREADVMYAKRLWEIIDLREKKNHPLYFPVEPGDDRKSMFDVIRHSLLVDRTMQAYGLGPTDDDDEFRYPLSYEEVDSLLNPLIEITYESLETGEDSSEFIRVPITSDKITQYQIKEDWIFDKQQAKMFVRIIAIMPMMEVYDDEGSMLGYKPLFWLYYPNARYSLVNFPVFNPKNGAQPLSFDDFMQKRLFSSYVIKEENSYNRSVASYAKGKDGILESDRIKSELFKMEHDLWSY